MKTQNNLLQITISPLNIDVPPAGTTQQSMLCELNVEVKNISTETLSLKMVGVQLPVSLQTSSVEPRAGQPAVWDFKAIATKGAYVATQKVPTPLQPQGSFNFILKAAVVHQTISSVEINVKVQLADGTQIPQTLNIQKVAATKSIVSFKPSPSDINPGSSSNLSWVTTGIDYCVLSAAAGDKQPATGNYNVQPNFTQTYTLLAHAPGVIISAQATVTITEPIGKIGRKEGDNLNYGEYVILAWLCNEITEKVRITCDDQSIVIPDNLPISGSQKFGPLTKSSKFILTPSRAGQTIVYPDDILIIVNQPAIKTFTATPDSDLYSKDQVVLTWAVTSAKDVTITPAIPGIASPMPKEGSVIIRPEKDVTYTLEATGASFSSKSRLFSAKQSIPLAIKPVGILGFSAEPNFIIPTNKHENKSKLTWNAQGEIITIDQDIVTASGTRDISPAVPVTNYTLTVGTKQNPVIDTRVVTVLDFYGPFGFTQIKTPQSPMVLEIETEKREEYKRMHKKLFKIKLNNVTDYANPVPWPWGMVGLFEYNEGGIPFFMVTYNLVRFEFPNKPLFGWTDMEKPSGSLILIEPDNTSSALDILKHMPK